MNDSTPQLGSVLNAMPFGVVFVDITEKITFANIYITSLFGYDSQELIGKKLGILLPKNLRIIHEGLFASYLKNPKLRPMGQDMELRGLHKDGNELAIEVGLGWQETPEGGIVMAFITDLSVKRRIIVKQQEDDMKHHMSSLDTLSTYQSTAVTARSYGIFPLKQNAPDLYESLVEDYALILDLALEKRAKKVNYDFSTHLRDIADQLGYLESGPRDVVDLHASALRSRTTDSTLQKTQAYIEEGNLVVLELMGHLVSYYRTSQR